ncbi:hypothetical protein GN244_ATG04164 [Phytophthora infestans]|uniref:Uncharacterized protein n=1 Tax=Phytophthora infestans TaxID=4787 RepID=A0A833T505_PHYIN|nr:hypothetical protein GN244_ATG04164 [Phytophthora infestans]
MPGLARYHGVLFMAFVAGDPQGHRGSVVLQIEEEVEADYPIVVDTGELVSRHMMLKISVDRFGNRFKPANALWRRCLRSNTLIPGQCLATARSSAFINALSGIIQGAVMRERRGGCEETV